jgi:hypothetical protein
MMFTLSLSLIIIFLVIMAISVVTNALGMAMAMWLLSDGSTTAGDFFYNFKDALLYHSILSGIGLVSVLLALFVWGPFLPIGSLIILILSFKLLMDWYDMEIPSVILLDAAAGAITYGVVWVSMKLFASMF